MGLIGKTQLLCMQCRGIGPHLVARGKSHGFSRVAAGTWGIFSSYDGDAHSKRPSPRILAPQPQGLRLRESRCASSQSLWASLPSLPSVSSSQAPTSFRMTLDVGPEDELPDWAAAKEFYQKYDPKDVIGR